MACAIKGVYASLWNQRAVEERTFARIDHATVAMGLSVVPDLRCRIGGGRECVVVTRVINAVGVFGYTLSVQDGNNLVTNPDPGTATEVTIAALGLGNEPTSFTVTRFATPVAGAPAGPNRCWPGSRCSTWWISRDRWNSPIARRNPTTTTGRAEIVVVDNEKPTSLDLELKILENGRFVCKQVREFGGK